MLLVSFVIGASIHMVADAVQHRLLRAGAKLHLTIQEQPILQVQLRNSKAITIPTESCYWYVVVYWIVDISKYT